MLRARTLVQQQCRLAEIALRILAVHPHLQGGWPTLFCKESAEGVVLCLRPHKVTTHAVGIFVKKALMSGLVL